MPNFLIVDDEKSNRYILREILEDEGYNVDEAEDGEQALIKIAQNKYDVVLCDIKMPKKDGMEVLEEALKEGGGPEFIMITAHGSIDTAIDATKKEPSTLFRSHRI